MRRTPITEDAIEATEIAVLDLGTYLAGDEAVLARLEGLLLDPVYSGRAMGGLIDLIKKGFFSLKDAVLFWHTGGAPALFAYARELTQIRH